MTKENVLVSWERVYDEYAPLMYGLINSLIKDHSIAEEIFMDAFLQFKEDNTLSLSNRAPYPLILRRTYAYAIAWLREQGIKSKLLDPPKEFPILHLLSSSCNSLKEAALKLHISPEECSKRLRAEASAIRNTNQLTVASKLP